MVVQSTTIPKDFDRTKLAIFYVAEDGTKTEIASEIVGDMIRFETNHLSRYVLAEKNISPSEVSSGNNTDSMVSVLLVLTLGILGCICVGYRKNKKQTEIIKR